MSKPVPVLMTVDTVALGIHPDSGLNALVIRRGGEPFKGRWALPGGFVDANEELEKAARRELQEETGVSSRRMRFHQIGTYGAARRDPRGRVVSVAWLTALPATTVPTAGDDAADADWQPVADLLKPRRLAFDHATILTDAVDLASRLVGSSSFATGFLPTSFTMSDLRGVYEILWATSLDAGNFQRRISGTQGLVRRTSRTVRRGRGRPATLFNAGTAQRIHPPLTRSE